MKILLDLLFPRFCVNCQKEGSWLCNNCAKLITIVREEICPQCESLNKTNQVCYNCRSKLKNQTLNGIIWAINYNPLARKLVHSFKYKFITEISHNLTNLLFGKISSMPLIEKKIQNPNSILIPLPLSKKRLRWRGFNQAEILAYDLCEKFNKDKNLVQNSILKKIKETRPQAELNKKERVQNIQGAFQAEYNPFLKNKTIFLIDDVATTFSTLLEGHIAILQAGNQPKEVWGLVIARG